jgi:hypothetical protein
MDRMMEQTISSQDIFQDTCLQITDQEIQVTPMPRKRDYRCIHFDGLGQRQMFAPLLGKFSLVYRNNEK